MQTLRRWDVFLFYFCLIIVWMNPENIFEEKQQKQQKIIFADHVDGFLGPPHLELFNAQLADAPHLPKNGCKKKNQKNVTTHGGHGIGDFQPGQKTPCFLGFYQWFCGPLGCESPPTESRFASLDGHKILPFWGPRALAPALLLGDGEVGLTKCTSKKYWYCDNGWWKKSGCNQLRWYK